MNGQAQVIHSATFRNIAALVTGALCVLFGTAVQAVEICKRDVEANVVVMDQPVLFNRLGASNVNGMIYSLARDVVTINATGDVAAITAGPNGIAETHAANDDIQVVAADTTGLSPDQVVVLPGPNGVLDSAPPFVSDDGLTTVPGAGELEPVATGNLAAFVGNVALRPDKRPRPLVLRIREGDCLTVNFTNLLTAQANPIKPAAGEFDPLPGNEIRPTGPNFADPVPVDGINTPIDDQVFERHSSFHVAGMQWVSGASDDSSFVGRNPDSTVPQGGFKRYKLYAEEEGVFIVRGMAATVGSDANQGNAANLLFGQVIVEPINARIYRSQMTEEEMRLASMDLDTASPTCGQQNLTPMGQPIVDYEALYPAADCDAPILACDISGTAPDATTELCLDGLPPSVNVGGTGASLGASVWTAEGKAGLPVVNMLTADNEIVHSEIHGMIVGPDIDGTWEAQCPGGDCPYPLESIGKRNPSLPNRLEPFRDFASVWHDEPATAQAFPGFYNEDPVFSFVLAGVKDGFMINYGSGGIGTEIIANRLGVGPMHDCLTCAYEEFFLTSFTVGDPAMLTDVAANMGLEQLMPGEAPLPGTTGPKATYVPYPEDPSNVHHSYTGDFVKFRNTHVGNEQHVFHLHNHQWLYNPNDDNSNYLDAQGIGPGIGYTYEINYGGSGNRMKSSGDAIFHCHFYPHFAQGMWYMWRLHDVIETGTPLQASGAAGAFHTEKWALENGTPLLLDATTGARARSLPDGEIVAGTPIPAVLPLPGKAMAPVPGEVTVVPNELTTTASMFHPENPGGIVPVGSVARVKRDNLVYNPLTDQMEETIIHPGYPFWIGGVEDIVGQRPPTPPLDMVNAADIGRITAATYNDNINVYRADGELAANVKNLFDLLVPAQADGWDGGLPRTALQGYAAGGVTKVNVVSPIDFSKVVGEAQAVFFPEEGTDVEKVAMAYHSIREHASYAVDMSGTGIATATPFVLNGVRPAVGAPFHEPCIDDRGDRFDAWNDVLDDEGDGAHFFWGGDPGEFVSGDDERVFDADSPRIYKGVNIQFDAVLNKAGYHYPQQRIISLWEDAVPIITKAKPPEPMVMRFNSFECGVYHHTNLVPEYYELDDYQVRTPTDIIGQHIHLPKWDLTTADGAANGWNYEDGTLSPGAVQERIEAVNHYIHNDLTHTNAHRAAVGAPADVVPAGDLEVKGHPYFETVSPPGTIASKWMGARTTTQRWFFDPVLNSDGIDRGLGLIFTHDHYGPSTHQQVGLYATVLTEPSKSSWYHNETGEQLGCASPDDTSCRADGGPTSWQAIIEPARNADGTLAATQFNPAGQMEPHREFYFEYSDFQHAYEAGVYVGADQNGEAIGGVVGADRTLMAVVDLGNPANCDDAANAFRCSINPPGRQQHETLATSPDLVEEIANTNNMPLEDQYCPQRPCPQAIDVEDPGMFAVNYRNEPVALRVYDPNKMGPDGKPGTQADGAAGDLAFALASVDENSQPIVRKFEMSDFSGASTKPPIGPGGGYQVLNIQPKAGTSIYGTVFPPPINEFSALKGGDPFTPMVRTMAGDIVRIKMQAGGDEEEHTATVHGIKWLQGGSAFGGAPNSGWRNAQPAGISEQFTLTTPVVGVVGERGNSFDYVYSMDSSQDGYWSGMWGLMRVYNARQNSLQYLSSSPFNSTNNVDINKDGFSGVCPSIRDGRGKNAVTVTQNLRQYDVTAVLANDILGKPATLVALSDPHPTMHEGGSPNPDGGTLVYNSRNGAAKNSLLHDPTAIIYVRTEDMVDPDDPTQGLKAGVPVEPLVLRGNAGDCIDVTLRNRLLVSAVSKVGGMDVIYADGSAVYLEDDDNKYVDANGNGVGDDAYCSAGHELQGDQCWDGLAYYTAYSELVNDNDVNFDEMPELATYGTLLGANKRDRGAGNVGSTTFQTNLIQASPWVGLHAQLVEYDASRDNGIHAGNKSAQTLVAPGGERTYRWYAGHLDVSVSFNKKGNKATFELDPTPVELGASNLQPADVIKQGMKSMAGQLVIEPAESSWPEESLKGGTALAELDDRQGTDPNGPGRKTRAMVTVTKADGSQFRDLSTIWAKGLTQYYADNEPVEHISGEEQGIPEDPQDGTGMAINYGIEPVWFRLGIAPNAHFGNAQGPADGYGAQVQYNVFSNTKVGGDPQTPVFTAPAGMETRMRIGMPHGTNRGSTFALHGHQWQRDPYITECNDNGFPNSFYLTVGDCTGPGVGSTSIGDNPLGFIMGGLESIWPSSHFDIRLKSAGGAYAVDGDYMFRDVGAIGSASGLWGILRVEPAPE